MLIEAIQQGARRASSSYFLFIRRRSCCLSTLAHLPKRPCSARPLLPLRSIRPDTSAKTSVRAFHGMVVEKTRDRVSRQSICRTSCAFLGVSNTDQTAALNPSDDRQRLIAVASDPGIDCPHIALAPKDQFGAALPTPGGKECCLLK